MEKTTRQLILEWVVAHGTASTAELSSYFHLSQAAIRYHIVTLIKQGEIEPVRETQSNSRPGHPARRFRIPSKQLPNNDRALLEASLIVLVGAVPAQEGPRIAHQLADALIRFESPLPPTPAKRIRKTLDYLDRHQYKPVWEARRHGPRIRLFNCPYSSLLPEYPFLCAMDAKILSELSGGQATQVDQI